MLNGTGPRRIKVRNHNILFICPCSKNRRLPVWKHWGGRTDKQFVKCTNLRSGQIFYRMSKSAIESKNTIEGNFSTFPSTAFWYVWSHFVHHPVHRAANAKLSRPPQKFTTDRIRATISDMTFSARVWQHFLLLFCKISDRVLFWDGRKLSCCSSLPDVHFEILGQMLALDYLATNHARCANEEKALHKKDYERSFVTVCLWNQN